MYTCELVVNNQRVNQAMMQYILYI